MKTIGFERFQSSFLHGRDRIMISVNRRRKIMNPGETYESLRSKSMFTTIYMNVVTVLDGLLLFVLIIGLIGFYAIFTSNNDSKGIGRLLPSVEHNWGWGFVGVLIGLMLVFLILVSLLPFVLNLVGTILGYKYAKREKEAYFGMNVVADASGTPVYVLPDFTYFKKDAILKIVLFGIECLGFLVTLGGLSLALTQDESFLPALRSSAVPLVFGICNIVGIVLMSMNLNEIAKWREYLTTIRTDA